MQKFPTWTIIAITAALLFGGLEIADLLAPPGDESQLKRLSETPPTLFLGVGIPVVILEALFWTVLFVELAAKYIRLPLLGATLGIFGYGVAFHWSGGVFSILVSSWIALILNGSYVLLRQRSRLIAITSTVAHKVAFILLAALGIYVTGA